MRLKLFRATLALALVFAQVSSSAQDLPELGDTAQSVLTPGQERQIGAESMAQLRGDKDFLDDVEVTEYVNDLGYRLVAASDDSRQDFEFFAMRDNTLNAFAMPGGYVGVHSGLIQAAQTESELAAVLAHEIAHVTQHHIARLVTASTQASWTTLAALALAILAARSNSQASEAAVAAASANAIQTQLDFTREHEREADRIGLQTLQRAGYDPRAMASFFERLQRFGRPYDSNAPKYLRTHPLTTERIAAVQDRVQQMTYKQVPDSLDFELMRAKLRATLPSPRDALKYFETTPANGSTNAAVANSYGRALALMRVRDFERAEEELTKARKTSHAVIENLTAQLKLAEGKNESALNVYRAALKRFPAPRALAYGYVDALLAGKQAEAALKFVNDRLQLTSNDYRLYELQARAHSALGHKLKQHRAQAEAYARRGNLSAAIDQLQSALRANDADFYESSAAEARLKELRAQFQEERKDGRAQR